MDRSALKPIVYVQTQVAIRVQSKANIFYSCVSLLDITTASPLPPQRPRTVSSFFQFFSAPPSVSISSKRKIATHSSTRTNTKRRNESSRMVAVLMKRITQPTTLSIRMNHRKSTRAKTTGSWMFTTVSRALYEFYFLLLIRVSMANLFWLDTPFGSYSIASWNALR